MQDRPLPHFHVAAAVSNVQRPFGQSLSLMHVSFAVWQYHPVTPEQIAGDGEQNARPGAVQSVSTRQLAGTHWCGVSARPGPHWQTLPSAQSWSV